MSLKILGENVMKQTKVVKHWQKQLESSWSGALDYHHSFKLREEVETLYTRRAELHQLGEENLHANPPRHAAALKCYQESLMICIDLFGPKHFTNAQPSRNHVGLENRKKCQSKIATIRLESCGIEAFHENSAARILLLSRVKRYYRIEHVRTTHCDDSTQRMPQVVKQPPPGRTEPTRLTSPAIAKG